MKPEIIPASADHIPAIAAHVREADRAELWAASCSTPEQALARSLGASRLAWTGTIDGVPVCMFGVAPASILGDVGRPWMIGTDHLDRHPFVFLRRCKGCVKIIERSLGDPGPNLARHSSRLVSFFNHNHPAGLLDGIEDVFPINV